MGLLGSLFGGETKTTSKSDPWAPQGDALKSIYGKAGSLYDSKAGTPWYGGDLYANMDPATRSAITGTLGYTGGTGAEAGNAMIGAGQSMIDPSRFNGAMGSFGQMAGSDPTQANIRSAQAYANNPAINGMIDAASRDVTRNLGENTLPGIDRAASGSGNINSSRAGVASGIAQRGAQDQIGDISANIRGDAYNRGLAMAEGARTTNMGATGQLAGMYGDQIGQGGNFITAGNGMMMDNFGRTIDASRLFQEDQQGQMDADFQRWSGNDTRDQDLLSKYHSIVGSGNWGGTQENTQSSSGNIFGQLMGGASILGGLGVFGGAKK